MKIMIVFFVLGWDKEGVVKASYDGKLTYIEVNFLIDCLKSQLITGE